MRDRRLRYSCFLLLVLCCIALACGQAAEEVPVVRFVIQMKDNHPGKSPVIPPLPPFKKDGTLKKVRKNIEARLSDLVKAYKGTAPSQAYSHFIEEAPEQVLKAMQPYGYYKPVIRTHLQNNPRQVVFTIDPGPIMRVGNIHITLEGEGKNNEALKKVVQNFPLSAGEPLLIHRYLSGKASMASTAIQEGYLKANMEVSEVRINLKSYTSQIVIRFNTGKRFYFGETTFTKTPFSEEYLKRYVPYQKGVPFSPSQMTTLQNDLSGTQQFSQVNVFPEYNDVQNQSVPVLVQLKPAPSQSYTFGAGYGTDTGIRGSVGWNLLRASPSGHKFQALLQGSQTQNTAQAQYLIPGQDPTHEEYAITGSIFNLNYPNSQSGAAQVSGSYRHREGYAERTFSINTLYERYTINDAPDQNALILYPSANWKYRKVDNEIFAKNGYSLSFSTQGGAKPLASTVNFAQVEMVGRYAKTFNALHGRFYTQTDIGMTAVSNIDDLPPSLQFYTGGAQSVRGYAYQSLGPGKALMVGSVEWQQGVIKNGYLTFFYDMGNAFNNTPIQLEQSVGGGIMYVTPVGPLRLYAARTLDDVPGNSKLWHIVFSMGSDL